MGQKLSICSPLFSSMTTSLKENSKNDENQNLKNVKSLNAYKNKIPITKLSQCVSVSEKRTYYVGTKPSRIATRRSCSDSNIVYGKNKRPPEKHLQEYLSQIPSFSSSKKEEKRKRD